MEKFENSWFRLSSQNYPEDIPVTTCDILNAVAYRQEHKYALNTYIHTRKANHRSNIFIKMTAF
jgi:hypothetical protein